MRDETVATFEAAGIGVGVELGAQAVHLGDRNRAVSDDVLPAIRQCASDIGRSDVMTKECAGLEQIGATATEIVRNHKIGAAAGEGKTQKRVAREAIVGADGS